MSQPLRFVAVLFALQIELLHLLPLLLRTGFTLALLPPRLLLLLADNFVLSRPQLEQRLIRCLLGRECRFQRCRRNLLVSRHQLLDRVEHRVDDCHDVLL